MNPERILIVDDRPENVESFRLLLEPEGYRLEAACGGEEAVERALASPPDLILMDVRMPDLDGFEACRRLKGDERTRLVPILLVTALADHADRLQGIAAGCDDFLTKPVDRAQLLARTRTALRTKALTDQLEGAENVLVSLANALDAKDAYTRGHSERVARYAEGLGSAAGLSREDSRNLRRAGLLHDIGKIGVRSEYLEKPARLTTEEYELVKLHATIGDSICRPLKTMAPLVVLIRGHHERLDGRGYPDGLRGGDIPVSLRCLSIVDVYDALTSDRPYRKSMPAQSAFRVMREEAGMGMWDGRLIELLADLVTEDAAAFSKRET